MSSGLSSIPLDSAAKTTVKKSAARTRKAATKPLTALDKIKDFYKKRAKDPIHYTYTPEGDLRISGMDGVPDEIIPLRAFTDLKPEEFQQLEVAQKEALDMAEADYEEALIKLREAVEEYKTLGDEAAMNVIRMNQEVLQNSLFRNQIAYPTRWIKNLDNPTTSDIILNMPYEKRKTGYDVYLFKRLPYTMKDALGHYRSAEEIQQIIMSGGANNGEPIFINGMKESFMHPTYEQEFVYEGTRYVSPYQAYEAERFRELNMEDIRKQILGTRSSRTIHSIADKEEKGVENPKLLWESILLAFYEQNKDLAKRLKETGSAKLHLMENDYGVQIYTDALESVRALLRENEANDTIKGISEIKESVISRDEQEKAKKGAIIHAMRRRGF